MFDIITFGSVTRDILVIPKKLTTLKYKKSISPEGQVCFPLGSKIDVNNIEFYSGGGATNTATTFSLQGFKTAFCGMVGDDLFGREVIKELKGLGINTNLVVKTNRKPTGQAVIILGDLEKDRTVLVYRGASELMEKKDISFKKLKAKWFYLAPLSGLLRNSFEDIINFTKENQIKVAVNPGIAQLSLSNFPEIAKKIDILILNQEEASFLTKIPYNQEGKIFRALKEMCPNIILMTKGADGVLVSDDGNVYSTKPHPDRIIVDTTGAGDSFASGFVTEFIRTKGDIEKAIQLGMANSEGCLSQFGAKNGLLKKGKSFRKVEVVKSLIR